jgi:NB-ARC domain
VARQAELAAIHETLSAGTGRQAVTLHGLGGIGKTQLAIAYTKAHRGDYSAIFWLNIKDEVSVKQSYSQIARRILQDCPSVGQLGVLTDDKKQDEVVAAVKRWLEHAKNTWWLMVFDNYDNPKVPGNVDPGVVDIRQFLPEAHHGSVIVTTRLSTVNIGRRIKVEKLDIRDGLKILSDASHREGVMDGQFFELLYSRCTER